MCIRDRYDTFYICLDMKFLRPVVDINEQKIIKKQVLDEIIFIEPDVYKRQTKYCPSVSDTYYWAIAKW